MFLGKSELNFLILKELLIWYITCKRYIVKVLINIHMLLDE